MRKKIVAGNWKMNTTLDEGIDLINEVLSEVGELEANHQVIVCPPYTHLATATEMIDGSPNVFVGAQNCHQAVNGAFTGEVSADMLALLDVTHVILGHSERRAYQKEDDQLIAEKVQTALSHGLHPIFCCGESLDIREASNHIAYVTKQVEAALFGLSAEQMQNVIVAYEPVWAIGTGKTASAAQAQEIHAAIRAKISEQFGDIIAQNTTILYGGSCKPSNAKELFAEADVDGGLIGGASLKAKDFAAIVAAL